MPGNNPEIKIKMVIIPKPHHHLLYALSNSKSVPIKVLKGGNTISINAKETNKAKAHCRATSKINWAITFNLDVSVPSGVLAPLQILYKNNKII